MTFTLADFDRIAKHVWTEPKFVAEVEWHGEYGLAAQLGRQAAPQMEQIARGEQPTPNVEVTLAFHEPPDFDWWEPRHDQPWRRQAARDRGEAA
jgi:hypothetical protein